MAKKVFIVGGDGFARECYHNLMLMRENDSSIEFGGFLGHGGYGHTVDYKEYQKFYLGEEQNYDFKDNEYAVIGAGYPHLRRKIYSDLKKRGVKFFNILVDTLKDTVVIGEANVFAPKFTPSCDVIIGNGNVFNGDVGIGHDVVIGDFNFFGGYAQVLGCVKVGNDNTIGTNSVLLPHARIGNGNKIAPLSAVYKGCKDNSYMLGNPALKIGNVQE